MNHPVFATEIMSILVILAVVYGNWFETKQKGSHQKAFMWLASAMLLPVVTDALTWALEGNPELRGLLYILSAATILCTFGSMAVFVLYIYQYVSMKAPVSRRLFQGALYYTFVAEVLVLLACLQGQLFYIDEAGYYRDGQYYAAYLILYLILFLYIAIVIGSVAKKIGIHDTVAAMVYLLIPFVCVLLNVAFPGFVYAYSAAGIELLVIYVMLQSDHEETLIHERTEVSDRARRDELTGLLNRQAYTDTYDRLNGGEAMLGVLFCDLNGLKYANDHYGHQAGDKLLCSFAQILLCFFRREEIYRISGDEFVVLLPGISREELERRSKALKQRIREEEYPVAAVGTAHGTEAMAAMLLEEAEEHMYQNKQVFYDAYPEYKRS